MNRQIDKAAAYNMAIPNGMERQAISFWRQDWPHRTLNLAELSIPQPKDSTLAGASCSTILKAAFADNWEDFWE
jgi:hypothetical protein